MLDNSSFHTTLQIIHLNEQIFYTYLYNSCLYKFITSLNCYSLFSNKGRQTNKQKNINKYRLGIQRERLMLVFIGTITLKISRNNHVAKFQQLYGNVGSSQQELTNIKLKCQMVQKISLLRFHAVLISKQ